MQNNEWPEILTESIVYGLLFKAVARDADSIDFFELKMSYRPILDAISTWSERKHHEYRRKFAQLGGKIHVQESPISSFIVSSLRFVVINMKDSIIRRSFELNARCA